MPHCAAMSWPYGQVGHAVVERVADHAAPAEVGDREPQLVAAGPDRVVEVEPAHPGLDDGIGALLVDLEHAIHVAEADDHRPAHARRRAAVAVVAALAVRPERHLVLVRDPQDLLDLLDRRRHDDGRGGVVVPARVGERIAELRELRLRGQHGGRAEGCDEAVEGGRERLLRRRGREGVLTSYLRAGGATAGAEIIARTGRGSSCAQSQASALRVRWCICHADHAATGRARRPRRARARRRRLLVQFPGRLGAARQAPRSTSRCATSTSRPRSASPPGSVTLRVRNRGPDTHELLLVRDDGKASAASPRRSHGRRGALEAAHLGRSRPTTREPIACGSCTSRPVATCCSATCPATTSAACTPSWSCGDRRADVVVPAVRDARARARSSRSSSCSRSSRR